MYVQLVLCSFIYAAIVKRRRIKLLHTGTSTSILILTLDRHARMVILVPRYDDTAGSATEAAKKSLEMGKETVELAAARAAEGAAGKAKDKVKGVAAPARPSSSGAEL